MRSVKMNTRLLYVTINTVLIVCLLQDIRAFQVFAATAFWFLGLLSIVTVLVAWLADAPRAEKPKRDIPLPIALVINALHLYLLLVAGFAFTAFIWVVAVGALLAYNAYKPPLEDNV